MDDDDLESSLRAQRPITRGDCKDGDRPCPWASCRYHLAINMSHGGSEVVMSFPDLEIWEIPETCALDVADRGDHRLEEIAKITNVTRERIRQIEARSLITLRPNRNLK